MNYIKEIKAFYDWYETNQLTVGSISLWHGLMHLNNKCNWSKSFTVTLKILLAKCDLNKDQLYRARKSLVDSGRISIRIQGGEEATIYTINPFFDENGELILEQDKTPYWDKTNASTQHVNDAEKSTNESPNKQKKKQIIEPEKTGVSEGIVEIVSQTVSQNDGINHDTIATMDATQSANIINKLNKTKLNKTKLNYLEEDKSSSSAGDFQKLNLISFFNEYNELCTRLTKAKIFSKRRSQEVGARLHEHGAEAVHDVIRLAAESDFLCGNSNSGWQANFDWIFSPTNFVKILEGHYGNKSQNLEFADFRDPHNHRNRYADEYIGKPSPIEILEQCYKDTYGDDDIAFEI